MAKKDPDPAAVALEAKRKRYDLNCVVCGKPFKGLRFSKYCNSLCRYAAANERKRGKTTTPRGDTQ